MVETIFDHDPTPDELASLFNIRTAEELDVYKRTLARGTDTQRAEIAKLYLHRGMREKAVQYIDSIQDPQYRFTIRQGYLYPDCQPR